MLCSSTSFLTLSLTTVISINGAVAQLSKPALQSDLDNLAQGLWNNLKPTQSTKDLWGWGWIPETCKSRAESSGFSPYDIEVFNVRYTDCDTTWIMCRHHDSPISQGSMIDIFGRMPVHSREWVRHVMAFPGSRGGLQSGGDIMFFGDTNYSPAVFFHEISHAVDLFAFAEGRLSDSQNWVDNYNLDSAVADNYAKKNQGENFAQETVVGLYDKVVPGGFGSIQSNWKPIFHQYATSQGRLGDILVPGGKCRRRWNQTKTVCMGSAAGCGGSARLRSIVQKPDTTVPGGIPVPSSAIEEDVACDFSKTH